ncbi:MAG TPA: Hpt domain-containing protein [Longimicrobiales bacterium]|nr:Hpt domain-containing protein [Longimicrobiales bacterium]
MDDLKQFFRSALSTRIEALETAATTMEADPVGALGTIRRLAHSLRGSGATYGYPQITDAATAVEEAEPEDVPPLVPELVKTLKAVVAELREPRESKASKDATEPNGPNELNGPDESHDPVVSRGDAVADDIRDESTPA